ncbi:serine racemase isoform X2 [Sigmodon hispidus]
MAGWSSVELTQLTTATREPFGKEARSSKDLKPKVKVYAVEPLNADDCYQSKLKGELTPNLYPPETIADGVKCSIGLNIWPIIRDLVGDVYTVIEDEIKVQVHDEDPAGWGKLVPSVSRAMGCTNVSPLRGWPSIRYWISMDCCE